jgi:hypothetical protein
VVKILERDETMGDVLKRRTAKGKTLRVKFGPRMVRKLDLHEDAIFRHCGSAVEIMGFEYVESARPIPVFADRRLRVDATTTNCRSLNISAKRIGCCENNSVAGECASMTISAGDWP